MFNNICKSNANQSFSPTTTTTTNNAIATVTTTNNFNHNNQNFINGYTNNLNGNGNKSDDDRSGINQNNNKNSSSPPPPSELPSNKFASNKATSYYHTFNCSRDMKKRKTVHNFLHRDMTNNTINELRNNFERLFSNGGNNHDHTTTTTTTTSSTTITNNNHNKNHKTRQFSNRQDILMNTERQKKFPLTCYGDDLSNIDVKSLVSTSLVCC